MESGGMTEPVAEIVVTGKTMPIAEAFEIALGHHGAGRLVEAEAIYRRILDIAPDHADSLHLMGLLFHQAGQAEPARQLIGRAIAINPDAAPYHNSLAGVLLEGGQVEPAVAHYRRAQELRPESPEIASNLGSALRKLGRSAEAADCYRRALHHAPDQPVILYNLGNALLDLGQSAAAEVSYREALRLKPDYPDAYYNLGNLLILERRWAEAETVYRTAQRLRPDHAATLNNLGTVLQALNRPGEAERCYRAAVEQAPDYAEAHYNLGAVCQADGRRDVAAACYERALALHPRYGAARMALCMAQLPVLYDDAAEIPRRRAAYERELSRLCADAGTSIPLADLAEGAGASQPFFLPYQGQNDRALQSVYGDLLCRIMAARHPERLEPPTKPDTRIRIGIVSGFFQDHTIWKLFIEGWLTQIDRSRFALYGYHTGTIHDAETDLAARLCDRFVEGGRSAAAWRQLILEDRPDVLLYPEIGMDPTAAQLGAMRLAPRQFVTWGHPETTGYPTIDGFLTSALMEPADGAAHYTEPLIALPNLGAYYVPATAPVPVLGRIDFGLRTDAVVYWSGQAIYKYLPQHDAVFPRIASQVPGCQFVFIEFAKSRAITAQFRARLDRAFAASGLDAAAHCMFLPPMDQGRFIAAVGRADVVLDTIGWSGGKSTLDCLAVDPAIVTFEADLMRGRHTAAILRRMGLPETIAATVDEYVATAVRLGLDPTARQALRSEVGARKSLVYRDQSYIGGLEALMENHVRG